jgi:hypothetical protein
MPESGFPEYARTIQKVLDAVVATGEATLVSIQVDQRSAERGYITGQLHFADTSELHFREFVDTTQSEPKLMYAYHVQDAKGALIFRYDNAAHRPRLPQPEHKHSSAEVRPAAAPTLGEVVNEILQSSQP